MKKLIALIIVIVIASSAYSQVPSNGNKKKDERKHELGFEVTKLINIFNGASNSYPYFITYRRNFEKTAFRIGFWGDTRFDQTIQDFPLKNEDTSIRVRTGFEWQRQIERRLELYYGLDASYYMNRYTSIATSPLDTSSRKVRVHEIGIGPNFGLKIKLSDRLLLSTETNFIVSVSQTSDIRTFSGFPNSGLHIATNSLNTIIYYPTSIFLLIQL
ncbi:MAG: hypothetical protein IIA45_11720 [Bacteroidetes bacterium]|nr:hypothetical protein [Bacteroidota bacterium]